MVREGQADGTDGRPVLADPVQHPDRQQIRLAVVLNGGVSLAVWISGVVLEMHRLVQASRAKDRVQDGYGALLELLDADARIDVIAGTSAGGLNGGFLALGLVHGCDLDGLRDLWRDKGDLGELLRDPRQKKTPSVLRGEYFHEQLANAYRAVLHTADPAARPPRRKPSTCPLPAPCGLVATARSPTTWAVVSLRSITTPPFTSAPILRCSVRPGRRRATYVSEPASRHSWPWPRAVPPLSRGAFEPFWVDVPGGGRVGDRWQSSAGLANFARSQFVVDGGLLLNKPIRPAIEAVYRQSAAQQVRRVLAYVVPDPGEAPPPAPTLPSGAAHPAPPRRCPTLAMCCWAC